MPPNWPDDPDRETPLEIMNAGIRLIWVPRSDIVERLTTAGNADARGAILGQTAQEIVDDCEAVLADVTAPDLQPLASLAGAAGRALRDGHGAASQALAANVFDTWLRDAARRGVVFIPPKGYFRYPHVVRQMKPLASEVRIRDLRELGVQASILAALRDFGPGDAIPAEVGRHPTAHAAGPEQYTDVNAVIALMLTTSVLRQAQASGWRFRGSICSRGVP